MSQPNQRYGFDPRRANEGGAPYQQNYQHQQPHYNAGGLQNPYDNRSGIPNPTGQHQQYAPSTTAPYGSRPVAINQQNPNPAAMYHPQSGPPNQAAPYSVNSNYHPTQSPTATGYSNTAPTANNNYYPSGNNPVSNNTSLNSLKETLAKTISSITAAAANNNSTGYQQGIAPGGRQLVPPTRMVPGDVRYQSTVPTIPTTAVQNPGTTGGFYNRRPEGNMAGPGQRDLSTAYDPSIPSYHTTTTGSTALQQQQQHGVHTGYSPAHSGLTGQRSSATQQYASQQQQQYAPQQYPPPQQHQHPATTTNHTGQYPLDQYKQTGVPAFSPTHSPVLTAYNTTPVQRDMYVPTTGNNPRDQYLPTGNIPRDQYLPAGNISRDPYAAAGNIPRDQYVPTGSNHYIPPQHAAVQPPTRWSQRLMDPLDLHDGLLHSIFTRPVHTSSTERMHTTASTRVSAVPPPTATATSGRNVNTSDLSRYGPGRGGSSPTSTKRRRERSVSPVAARTITTSSTTSGRARPRSRSRSITPAPSSSTNTGSSAIEMPPPSGTRRSSHLPYGARPARALTYSHVPVAVLNEEYHLPNIRIHTYPTTLLPPPQQQLYNELTAPTTQCVNSIDLYTHFPKLYLPNDFASINIADNIIETALHNDVFSNLMNTVPIEIESNNPTLLPNSHPSRILSTPTESSNEVPKFSYVPSNTLNNKVFSEVPRLTDENGQRTTATTTTSTKAQFIGSTKPVKFQVRVLVSCGLKDPASERLDHNLAQKLRVLCGRRKGNVQLFGCPWSAELDKDDNIINNTTTSTSTPIANRSLLVRTAQRALYAQCLLHIPITTTSTILNGTEHHCYASPGLVKLCELNYHRPAETIKGKLYPEQLTALDDIATLKAHQTYCRRVQGIENGPLLNRCVYENQRFLHDLYEKEQNKESECKEQEGDSSVLVKDDNAGMEVDTTTATNATADGDVQEHSADTQLQEKQEETTASNMDTDPSTSVQPDTAIATTDSTTALAATTTALPLKTIPPFPTQPTVFLCPMALTAEAAGDASKRQDALALRLQPLQSLLSYDLEDRSERLFEASIAAELLRSVLSVNFADTLTDFILSEHEELSGLCDQRVVAATKKLRAMIQADRQRTTTTTTTTATTAATTADSGVTDQDTADKTMDTDVTYVVDGSGSSTTTTAAAVDSTSSTDVAAADADNSDVVAHTVSTTTAAAGDTIVAESKEAPTEQTTEPILEQSTVAVVADTQQHCSDDSGQEGPVEMTSDRNTESMCETEARLWRKRFVSAARWYDKTEEMCLHYEHLKMILHSSTRNLSRADVEDALERVCTKDILRYESFV